MPFLPPSSPISSNSTSPNCLGEPTFELAPDKAVDFPFEAGEARRKIGAQRLEGAGVDADAGVLHRFQHRNQGAFQGLVDGDHVLGGEARLEQPVEAPG